MRAKYLNLLTNVHARVCFIYNYKYLKLSQNSYLNRWYSFNIQIVVVVSWIINDVMHTCNTYEGVKRENLNSAQGDKIRNFIRRWMAVSGKYLDSESLKYWSSSFFFVFSDETKFSLLRNHPNMNIWERWANPDRYPELGCSLCSDEMKFYNVKWKLKSLKYDRFQTVPHNEFPFSK